MPDNRRDDFDGFGALVAEHGYCGRFPSTTHRHLDGWRCWTPPSPSRRATWVPNRADNERAPIRSSRP